MVTMTWLGINGFAFQGGGRTVLIDPYVSRDKVALCRPEVVRRHVPAADTILLGHSHWDHLADVPEIATRTGCSVFGSQTSLNLCRCLGVPEDRLGQFQPGQEIRLGPDCSVTPIRSLHKTPVGYPGEYSEVPRAVTQASEYLEGGTWALRLRFPGVTVLNVGSANLIREELRGLSCNVLLASIGGVSEAYLRDLLDCVRADVLVPTHYDDYLHGTVEAPGGESNLAAFRDLLARVAPAQRLVVPRCLCPVRLPIPQPE